MSAPYAGGCLCGQVRWRAPDFARALFRAADVTRTGQTTRWA